MSPIKYFQVIYNASENNDWRERQMVNYNQNYGYGYPYGVNYQIPYQQPNYNNMGNVMNNQNQQPQMQQTQTSYLPLTYVSGLIGAKSFIVAPNQTVYLRDSDEGSNMLFEKSADPYGKYTIKAYRMVEVNLDDVGKPINENEKKFIPEVATKEDLTNFKLLFESKINELSSLIQKTYRTPKNTSFVKDSDKNE